MLERVNLPISPFYILDFNIKDKFEVSVAQDLLFVVAMVHGINSLRCQHLIYYL